MFLMLHIFLRDTTLCRLGALVAPQLTQCDHTVHCGLVITSSASPISNYKLPLQGSSNWVSFPRLFPHVAPPPTRSLQQPPPKFRTLSHSLSLHQTHKNRYRSSQTGRSNPSPLALWVKVPGASASSSFILVFVLYDPFGVGVSCFNLYPLNRHGSSRMRLAWPSESY